MFLLFPLFPKGFSIGFLLFLVCFALPQFCQISHLLFSIPSYSHFLRDFFSDRSPRSEEANTKPRKLPPLPRRFPGRWENFLVSLIDNSPLSAELEDLDKALRVERSWGAGWGDWSKGEKRCCCLVVLLQFV